MSETILNIELLPGDMAPRYNGDRYKKVGIEKVVITEQGTEAGLPIVDIQMIDENGDRYYACVTGRLVNALAAAIQGVNLRNHGKEEP